MYEEQLSLMAENVTILLNRTDWRPFWRDHTITYLFDMSYYVGQYYAEAGTIMIQNQGKCNADGAAVEGISAPVDAIFVAYNRDL